MPDDYFSRTAPPGTASRKPAGIGRLIGGVALLSFLAGGGLIGWLAYDGKLRFDSLTESAAPARIAGQPGPKAAVGIPTAPMPAKVPAPLSSTAAVPALPGAAYDQRLAQIEQRVNALDLRTQTATGNAARAEGLLIALAARRAVERGMPLGSLEDQLRLRFGAAQPSAVQVVIDGARQPVTLSGLDAGLTEFAARTALGETQESGWDRFSRQVSNMFVIKRTSQVGATPVDQRLDQARLLLRTGQSEAAASLIAAMPGSVSMRGWIADARRHAALQQALDQIEAAAILEPRDLKDARGAPLPPGSPASVDSF